MEIQDAFPICSAKLLRGGDETQGDLYCVTRAEGRRVRLEAPAAQVRQGVPGAGEEVTIQSLLPDAVYLMPAQVVASEEGAWVHVICEQAGDIRRIQRRGKHRLLAEFPLSVTVEAPGGGETLQLQTEDLHSEGMRFLCRQALPPAATVTVALDLRDGAPALVGDAHIVRCRAVGEGRFECGAQFVDLDEPARERIIDALLRQVFDV
jgi:c-di-GMP-binding flagellar brake protein YcgR